MTEFSINIKEKQKKNRAKNTKYKIYISEKLVKATEICQKRSQIIMQYPDKRIQASHCSFLTSRQVRTQILQVRPRHFLSYWLGRNTSMRLQDFSIDFWRGYWNSNSNHDCKEKKTRKKNMNTFLKHLGGKTIWKI